MVSTVLPQVNLDLQQSKKHQMINPFTASKYAAGLPPHPAIYSSIAVNQLISQLVCDKILHLHH
jgi:hypothetical protein